MSCLLDSGVALSSLNSEGRGFVHRIDRGTSGCFVLVLAKTNECHALLVSQLFLRNYTLDGQQLLVPPAGPRSPSSYVVEEQISSQMARLRIVTAQGRQYQVRMHCSKGLPAPIVLDPLCGGKAILFQVKSQLLQGLSGAERKFCLHQSRPSVMRYLSK